MHICECYGTFPSQVNFSVCKQEWRERVYGCKWECEWERDCEREGEGERECSFMYSSFSLSACAIVFLPCYHVSTSSIRFERPAGSHLRA